MFTRQYSNLPLLRQNKTQHSSLLQSSQNGVWERRIYVLPPHKYAIHTCSAASARVRRACCQLQDYSETRITTHRLSNRSVKCVRRISRRLPLPRQAQRPGSSCDGSAPHLVLKTAPGPPGCQSLRIWTGLRISLGPDQLNHGSSERAPTRILCK